MEKIFSDAGQYMVGISTNKGLLPGSPSKFEQYTIIVVQDGYGSYQADNTAFSFSGPTLIFITPGQSVTLISDGDMSYSLVQFHTDFYCIEAHQQEIACNGILFNTVHTNPMLSLTDAQLSDFNVHLGYLQSEMNRVNASPMVLKAYLQLFLAKCSTIKVSVDESQLGKDEKDHIMEQFRILLDKHYLLLHKPNDYARLLSISSNTLSKKALRYYSKTPSEMIRERLLLEAKKMLNLTALSVKEIAYQLKFSDEYYFSRFFKKNTSFSPQGFRNNSNN